MLEARVSACSELIRRQGSGRPSRFFATYTMPSFPAFDGQHQFLYATPGFRGGGRPLVMRCGEVG